MKKLLTAFSLVLLSAGVFAQAPKLINYQGIARGNDGAPVLNQNITLRFRILQGSITGSVAYTETQGLTTNSLGLINTQIGLKSDLNVLSWKNGPYFLEVGADLTGGNTIDVFGIQQIMGVPYAFHAATVPAAYNATTNVLDVGGNTFTLSSTPNTSISTQGIATVTNAATNSYVIGVQSPSYTTVGPLTIAGTYPDYTLTAQNATVTGTGNAVVTSTAANKFNVNVPFPQVTITSTAGATSISGSGTNTMNINIPAGVTPTINGSGAASILPATVGNNFTVNVPAANVILTNTPGLAGVTPIGTNTFAINLPAANIALTSTSGAYGVSSPGTNSFNINVPQSNVSVSSTVGLPGVSSAGTNSFNVNVPPAITPTLTQQGLVNISSSGSSFTVNVPVLAYTPANAVLGSGTNTLSILQGLTLNNTTLTSGPTSNSVNLATVTPWRQGAGTVTLTTQTDKVGIGTTAPIDNLQIESTGNTTLSVVSAATASADINFGTSANHGLGRIRYDNSIGAMSLWTAGASQFKIGSTGLVTVGASTFAAVNTAMVVSKAGAFDNQLLVTGGDATNSYGGMITFGENINPSVGMTLKLDAGGNRLAFTNDLTGTSQVMSIGGYAGASNGVAIGTGYAPAFNPPANGLLVEGFTGMGTSAPSSQLHVVGNTIMQGNVNAIGSFNISGPTNISGATNITGATTIAGAASISGNVNVGTSAVAPADIRVYGGTRMGTESGTGQSPAYPGGSTGLVVRRIFSSPFPVVAGHVVATSGTITFERDGTNGGFRVFRTGGTGQETCHCMGTTSSGGVLNKSIYPISNATPTQVYLDTDNIVFLHCMFGDPFNTGHITEISISRRTSDYYWGGTVTSTFNQ